MDDFSMKLKELRKEKGLTQKELGAAIGISEVMIGQYERGVRTPKIEMREKIAMLWVLPLIIFCQIQITQMKC